ncbi:hypothetical protein B0H34DRAFT_10436 [Crassisporium funariophilum]|nr:hypothetical protein B0H34DRAFT_10436 [Crassisporium funariophilum]
MNGVFIESSLPGRSDRSGGASAREVGCSIKPIFRNEVLDLPPLYPTTLLCAHNPIQQPPHIHQTLPVIMEVLAQHPPAMKVGGRRLSISSKHKAAATPSGETTAAEGTDKNDEAVIPDYPRPAPPTGGADDPQHAPHHNDEEFPPRKERKHGHENEKKMQEYAQRKAETTRPSRDSHASGKAHGMGARIAQPAGKAFGV